MTDGSIKDEFTQEQLEFIAKEQLHFQCGINDETTLRMIRWIEGLRGHVEELEVENMKLKTALQVVRDAVKNNTIQKTYDYLNHVSQAIETHVIPLTEEKK